MGVQGLRIRFPQRVEGWCLPHRTMSLLQLPPEPLLNDGKGCEAPHQVHVHGLIAGQEAFGEVLRYADGVGEAQGGGVHRGQDELAHQPVGAFYDGRGWQPGGKKRK